MNGINIRQQRTQAVMLYGATIIGLVFSLWASIINTDSLPSAEYGDVRYVQNLIQLFASLLLFGYFLSGSRLLALSNDETRSRRIRGVMLIILAVCAVLLFVAILVAAFFHKGTPAESNLLLISLPVCFYPLLINYMNTTAQGDNHIIRLSLARLLPPVLYAAVASWFFNSYGATPARMVLLQWGIYSLALLLLILSARPSFSNLRPIYRELNKENRSYGLLLYYGSLAMVATNYLAGVTLSLFNSDNREVGFYTLALTLTQPLAYLPAIVGTAYFKKFATQDCIPPRVMRTTLLLTLTSCICFVILIHPLVNYFYHSEYHNVGTYASWLSVGFCIHGVGDMINRYLGSHGQGRPILISSLVCGFVKLTGFIVLVWLWGINGALITCVASSSVYALSLYFYYKKFVGAQRKS